MEETYYKLGENTYTNCLGCYDKTGQCFCAECFYYGSDHVNCLNVLGPDDFDDVVECVWDNDTQQFVEKVDKT